MGVLGNPRSQGKGRPYLLFPKALAPVPFPAQWGMGKAASLTLGSPKQTAGSGG